MAPRFAALRQTALPALLLAVFGVPLVWATAAIAATALNLSAWQQLMADPHTLKALALTLWTGVMATALALGIAAWLLAVTFGSTAWQGLVRNLAPMLAVPHAAFAIGFAALIAPSGWLLRLISPWATGFDAPPLWSTTQDPWGLGLIAVLVFKEVPFLLWAAATQLQRADVANRWRAEIRVAQSMGYATQTAWWRVVWPQLWPRLRWPLLAVLAYGMTVVDVALVIGPTSPPPLAVLAWRWLLDANAQRNAMGAAAAWLLTLLLAALASMAWQLPKLTQWRSRLTQGAPVGVLTHAGASQRPIPGLSLGWRSLRWVYVMVLLALLAGSISGVWAFPGLIPQTFTGRAWASVADSAGTIATTLTLAIASTAVALLWGVAWLETAPRHWDALLRRAMYLPLLLPSVLWVMGVHAVALSWGIDAAWPGLWLAHTLAGVPYVLIALSPAYLGFDARYWHVSATLGHRRWAFLLRVKWPLLRAALASAAAVAFAVSVAQYLPTLFIGAGRFSTVTTEAVTLAAGAQRSLTSAYAGLQWLLPVLAFALAAWVARPRRFAP